MIRSRFATFVLGVAAAAFAAPAEVAAAAEDAGQLGTRTLKYYDSYVVNADGSHTEIRETELKVLAGQGVELARRSHVEYSASLEEVEVLEAYTRKADGHRIDAPQSNYQLDIRKGRDGNAPAFSDRAALTVAMPEVDVGDTAVFKYRRTQMQPIFAGHFSIDSRFSTVTAVDDLRIRFDTPASLWTQHAVSAMTVEKDEVQGDRHVVEITWKNPRAIAIRRRNFTVINIEEFPGVSFSTFRGYDELARAYGEQARPKAAPNEKLRALADEITKGKKAPAEQARALYDWISLRIGFAGNVVGTGAVIPRDPEFVIENRMGDCKDQATLLQALLAAKGISSTQALLNSGALFRLPKVPVLSNVNHVILYVPDLKLFLDTTTNVIPFGLLPMGDADKPVILVDDYREGSRTPPLLPSQNFQNATTDVSIHADGSVAGTVKVGSKGMVASTARTRLRYLRPTDVEEAMRRLYKREGKAGGGKLESGDPYPLEDSFHYKVQFDFDDFTPVQGPGAFTIRPFYVTEVPLAAIAAGGMIEDEAEETTCWGGSIVEEYVYHLPLGMNVISIPRNVSVSIHNVAYSSAYALSGNALAVKRTFVDWNDNNVCSVQDRRDFSRVAAAMTTDMNAQVVYR